MPLNKISSTITYKRDPESYTNDIDSDLKSIFLNVNGNLTGSNLSPNANISDTQLSTITTPGKVSGTAITSGDINILSTSTTTNPFSIDASSLTSGDLAKLYSNSISTDSKSLLSIINDNSLATGTKCLNIQQDSNYYAIDILASGNTTTSVFNILADSLTTASIVNLYSNSSSNSSRNIFSLVNDNSSATGTVCQLIQQDSNGLGLYLDFNGTVSDSVTGLRIDGCDVANGSNSISITNVAPAGVTTATISKWLAINIGGTMHYIPMWT